MIEDQIKLMIERGVELWCRKLAAPIFDNGDNSENSGIGWLLAEVNIKATLNKQTNYIAKIERFRIVLTDILITQYEKTQYIQSLSVDYGHSTDLAAAAKIAEIPNDLFSCKSSVYINDNDVESSFGYGGDHLKHYYLGNGNWLITSLRGNKAETNLLIESAKQGNPLNLTIETNNETTTQNI